MAILKPPPKPLAPTVQLTNQDGTPTREFYEYLTRLDAWLNANVGGINGRLNAIEAAIPPSFSWAPTLIGATVAGAHTYTHRFGYAQRVRDIVNVSIDIGLSAKDPAMAGPNVFITGLPWAAPLEAMLACGYNGIGNPTDTAIFGYIAGTNIGLLYSTSGGGWNWATPSMITNSTRMFMTGSYHAAPL